MNANSTGPASGRRRFLALGAGALAAGAFAPGAVASLLAAAGAPSRSGRGYGPLKPVADRSTGLPLLKLPEGFEYLSFGWSGEPLADGTPTPGAHDGMGIVRSDGDILTLVRNHEQVRLDGAFGPPASHYDPACAGGTVTLRFDTARARLLDAWPSLSGTMQNCAGGVTPWGSWLSCEEFVSSTAHPPARGGNRLAREHGFVFEVPAEGASDAQPLRGLGQFRHEAAVVHTASGAVYLTEDMEPDAGFYRFLPDKPGQLAAGGRLQMLQAVGQPDLRQGLPHKGEWPVRWVDIPHPEQGFSPEHGPRGVVRQGLAAGGSRFIRLEGCIAAGDTVYFTSTNGGAARCGQVFAYHVDRDMLSLVFESPSARVLDYPDNLCLSPRGGLVLCEDSSQEVQHLYGLDGEGGLFALAANNVVLDGRARGPAGDFRGAEWAGACFSGDGRWLFANIYSPGFSVAITGPWDAGPL